MVLTCFQWHLAREELFSSVAEDVAAKKDAPREGFATVGADVGERCAGPVMHQLGRWRDVCVRVCCGAALRFLLRT